MATNWFSDNDRAVASNLASMAIPLGSLVAFILGPVLINKDSGKEEVVKYIYLTAIINTCLGLPMILFYFEKPKSFPSKVAKE